VSSLGLIHANRREDPFSGAPGLGAGSDPLFFPGLHQPGDAIHFDRSCISIHRLLKRCKVVEGGPKFVDSAGFETINVYGGYPNEPEVYARHLHRLDTKGIVQIMVAASQDYMCEPHMLAKTGGTIADHQRWTIERYDRILAELHHLYEGPPPFELLPVLQGWSPSDYASHVLQYGERLTPGMWVGVGSVCKRQTSTMAIEDVLLAIKEVRPDLRLHGFWREDHGPAEPSRQASALQRRQHGLVIRGDEGRLAAYRSADAAFRAGKDQAKGRSPLFSPARRAPSQPQRLARGPVLPRTRHRPTDLTRATAPVLRAGGSAMESKS
jgi:hypothetical protein